MAWELGGRQRVSPAWEWGGAKLDGLRRLVRAQVKDGSPRMVQPGSGVAGVCHSWSVGLL